MSVDFRTRCLVIGLDGASPDLIRTFGVSGRLPNLSRLIAMGSFGTLESTMPPMSPSAWTSFMTGKNPGKHGVFDFTQRLTGTYRTHITSRSDQSTLWGLLSQQGRKVAVFNVPQTYPVEPVNGIMVTGLGTPVGRPFTHPPELEADLVRQGYRVDSSVHFRVGAEHEFLQASFDTARRNVDLIVTHLQALDWDLAVVVLRLTDEVPHFFWKYMDRTHPAYEANAEFADAVAQCYGLADELTGHLTSAAGDATVVVMSDHGFGPLYRDVYLNEWLRQAGFLNLRPRPIGLAALNRAMRRAGFTRSHIGHLMSQVGLSRLRGALRATLGKRATLIPNDSRERLSEIVDWRATLAYSMGYIGQVFINLAGREPQGIVQPAEYDRVVSEVAHSLMQMPDPHDGRPIVDRVLRRSEVYEGPFVKDAPDLFVVMRGFSYITRESYEWPSGGQYVVSPSTLECADHRPEGVLIMAGPGAARSKSYRAGARIIDVAPTILHLMGCPVPTDMDGHVLSEWLKSGFTERDVKYTAAQELSYVRKADTLSLEDEASILKRLRDLGYVE